MLQRLSMKTAPVFSDDALPCGAGRIRTVLLTDGIAPPVFVRMAGRLPQTKPASMRKRTAWTPASRRRGGIRFLFS